MLCEFCLKKKKKRKRRRRRIQAQCDFLSEWLVDMSRRSLRDGGQPNDSPRSTIVQAAQLAKGRAQMAARFPGPSLRVLPPGRFLVHSESQPMQVVCSLGNNPQTSFKARLLPLEAAPMSISHSACAPRPHHSR
jgi:hypothetical protein